MLNFILSLYINPAHSNERVPLSISPSMADLVLESYVALVGIPLPLWVPLTLRLSPGELESECL